jgi:two-component system CheB/CheR fusion protein
LIGVTSFFRDTEAFCQLEQKILPDIFSNKPPGSTIRVWVPGCSTGEEAYSIAMLLQEYIENAKLNFNLQIFATDIDREAISVARTGLYPSRIASEISEERLIHFFSKEPDGVTYRIHKTVRDLLIFSEQDLIKDPPFSKLDLISCCNLMIYLGPSLQKKIIPMFHYALNPGGTLFLGSSETVGDFNDLFSPIDRPSKLYKHNGGINGQHRADFGRFIPSPPMLCPSNKKETGKPKPPEKMPLRELTEQALLKQVVPAGALVNAKGDILYIHGRTGLYLEPASGEAGVNNILKMSREGLHCKLTTALHQARITQEVVCVREVRVRNNGQLLLADLTVCPVTSSSPDTPLYLVILAESLPAKDVQRTNSAPVILGDVDAHIAILKQELLVKSEYLQSTTAELETANEELKSSNEEMQSVNEELQS